MCSKTDDRYSLRFTIYSLMTLLNQIDINYKFNYNIFY